MSGKVIDHRAGDRWTRFDKDAIVLYRDGKDCIVTKDEIGSWVSAYRVAKETDLPTPDAHAQLREWGYEIRGDEFAGHHSMGYPKPFTNCHTVIIPAGRFDVTWAGAGLDNASDWASGDPPLTESRVREIVREELAKAKPAPGEVVVHATPFPQRPKPAPAPDDWRARCRVWQPTPDNLRWWAVHSPSGEYALSKLICDWRKMSEGHNDYGRNFESEAQARAALAKAPPPPDVSPEPDWRGLLAAVVHARSHTERDNAMAEAAKALSSARTKLAAKGGK